MNRYEIRGEKSEDSTMHGLINFNELAADKLVFAMSLGFVVSDENRESLVNEIKGITNKYAIAV